MRFGHEINAGSAVGERPFTWIKDPAPEVWDEALARLGGHPLQSTAWGEARRIADTIPDVRLMALSEGQPIWLMRYEIRRIAPFIAMAWAPRGPISSTLSHGHAWPPGLVDHLKASGVCCAVAEPQVVLDAQHKVHARARTTIWVDLTPSEDDLFAKTDKKWRNAVRRAEKDGLRIFETTRTEDIDAAFDLMALTADTKQFRLPLRRSMLHALIARSNDHVRSSLYLALKGEDLISMAFTMSCGRSTHYIAGATRRNTPVIGAAEALQWHIMRSARASDATRYDLEGIDETANPGTAAFKKKMGGEIVRFAEPISVSAGPIGALTTGLFRCYRRMRTGLVSA